MKINRKSEYLPKKLIQRIREEFFDNRDYEYRTKNNFLYCLGIIYDKQVSDYHSLYSYVATGSAYWKTVFSHDYYKKVIEPLLLKDIIQTKDFGFRKVYVGIRYRINPLLTDDDCEVIEYIDKGKVISAEEGLYNDGMEFAVGSIPDKNFTVSINAEKANRWIETNAARICNEYLHPEYMQHLPDKIIIKYHECLKGGSMNARYSSVEFAKSIAKTRDKELFYFKDAFYIANIPEFLEDRIPTMIHHYKREISKVGVFPVSDNINKKTLRLHNYLVNFPSKILQFIYINNQTVVQLDLRTSQFLLFANILNIYIIHGAKGLLSLFKHKNTRGYLRRLIKVLKTHKNQLPDIGVDINDRNSGQYSSTDVTKFIRDVFFTDFYSVVRKALDLPERSVAKQLLFKLLFKKSNRRDALLDKLIQHYPVVMSIIADFKKHDEKSGNKSDDDEDLESNFSVFLQCVEAEIFIDNILKPLRNEGIPCFTRHDSIVVASEYADEVELYAKTVFAKFGFKYNHKVEDKFWEVADFKELEESGYLDSFSDENEIDTEPFIEDNNEESHELTLNKIEIMKETQMDEQQINVLERLSEIGQQEDYYEFLDEEFLEEISNLSFFTQDEKNVLYNDVINLREGFVFLQPQTNNLLRSLFERL